MNYPMAVKLSKRDAHSAELMGADTVALLEMRGVRPRLENERQSRVDANIHGFKAEFAVARLFGVDTPVVNVCSDGGVDLWIDDISVDVKLSNKPDGPLIFDSADSFAAMCAVMVGRTEDPDEFLINGCATKALFLRKHYKHDFGYGERLVMDVKDLQPIEWLWRRAMERRFQ